MTKAKNFDNLQEKYKPKKRTTSTLSKILYTRSLFPTFHARSPSIDATSKDEWAWINNYIYINWWYAIINPCTHINIGLTKLSYKGMDELLHPAQTMYNIF